MLWGQSAVEKEATDGASEHAREHDKAECEGSYGLLLQSIMNSDVQADENCSLVL
jgi:hypothetical protein